MLRQSNKNCNACRMPYRSGKLSQTFGKEVILFCARQLNLIFAKVEIMLFSMNEAEVTVS